jgi:hypothetical protein
MFKRENVVLLLLAIVVSLNGLASAANNPSGITNIQGTLDAAFDISNMEVNLVLPATDNAVVGTEAQSVVDTFNVKANKNWQILFKESGTTVDNKMSANSIAATNVLKVYCPDTGSAQDLGSATKTGTPTGGSGVAQTVKYGQLFDFSDLPGAYTITIDCTISATA